MTIDFLTTPSCTSCRKAKAWLNEHDVDYTERNIFVDPLSKAELKYILRLSETGTDDLISTRSDTYKVFKKKIQEATLDELLDLLVKHPEMIRRPIMIDTRRLQVGYNDDEIRRFLPRKIRKLDLERMLADA
ncbi:transcriptional regulator Spx [Lentilactobacillus senioris]|uniref:Transcriptional regulator Spx n=1 Tax=Lentilactobacillus senioris DSM 24302 = JCM 17472 TaxID=1423802 RepID=A0A0R2D1P5_9LACO|nr:transcriptional regulator Spx [Lentilactobacillus senioris]KRM94102.1 transcriptional regulator Spx [Lentilactobacillus senioris DSM 24302 = JCM 17472]